MSDILQLKVSLKGSKPLIWRRILILPNTSFFGLHLVIQEAMGWENYHLFAFYFKDGEIGMPNDYDDEKDQPAKNAQEVVLSDMITAPKTNFDYLYDFGDSWEHRITVEKILPAEPNVKYPVCTGGAMNCPPEDSGGLGGFYESLEALKDKKHPDYADLKEWYGRYNPEDFNLDKINRELEKLRPV